jgi:hypothetical protein
MFGFDFLNHVGKGKKERVIILATGIAAHYWPVQSGSSGHAA